MIEPTVLESRQERALLVSVDTGDFDAAASLQELHELTRSAGAEPVFSVTQKREMCIRDRISRPAASAGHPGPPQARMYSKPVPGDEKADEEVLSFLEQDGPKE